MIDTKTGALVSVIVQSLDTKLVSYFLVTDLQS